MPDSDDERPTLLGPGGEPLVLPGTAQPASEPDPGGAEASELVSVPEPTAGQGTVPQPEAASAEPERTGPAFRISVVLGVDPRLIPAMLITMLGHDPIDAYRQRVEQTRAKFDQTRDVMIGAMEAQFRTQGVPENEAQAVAIRIVEQQFMSSLWDIAYETVSGNQVAMVFSASLAGPDRVAGTILAANYDVPKVWVTTRALVAGNRFGAWAVPVERERQMPVSVMLTAENFHPLRLSVAKVKV